MSVGIVVVSHSRKIAEGIVELAAQMAGSTRIIAAGGTDDGGIGTSFDAVTSALQSADDGGGVVVLCDLGSAVLTAETALDFLDDEARARTRIVDAPIVEGTVAAAVAAETGETLDGVVAAAETANRTVPDAGPVSAGSDPGVDTVSASTTLVNTDGLHARPASEFVRLASTFDASITVNGVDAKSLLRIMSLGLAAGRQVELEATGPDAPTALTALVALIDSGFGEPRSG